MNGKETLKAKSLVLALVKCFIGRRVASPGVRRGGTSLFVSLVGAGKREHSEFSSAAFLLRAGAIHWK